MYDIIVIIVEISEFREEKITIVILKNIYVRERLLNAIYFNIREFSVPTYYYYDIMMAGNLQRLTRMMG